MGRLGTAVKLFFKALGDQEFAARALAGPTPAAKVSAPTPARSESAILAAPSRSEAVTLLSVLQREARLVDFLKENIAAYSDAQVGAAVRDVHRDAAAALERMFAPRPVMAEAEGSAVQVPADAARVRLIGNVTAQPPQRGTLRHGGWEATKIELPQWSGAQAAAKLIAPAEVEC